MAETFPHTVGQPVVCYVSDRKRLAAEHPQWNFFDTLRSAAEARTDWIQIREKDLGGRDLLRLVREAVRTLEAATFRARLIVNDRLDVALAAGAAGVHLGGESASPPQIVSWCRSGNAPADFLIGLSCHSVREVRDAEESGVDYVFFGPIYDTPSKRAFGDPQGATRLREVCSAVEIPVIAIGGVNEENAEECMKAGAMGVAAIGLFQQSQDPVMLRNSVAGLHRIAARVSRPPSRRSTNGPLAAIVPRDRKLP